LPKLTGGHPLNPYPVILNDTNFNLVIAASADQYLLELEPVASDLGTDLQQAIGITLSEILADANLSRLLDKTAQHSRLLNPNYLSENQKHF
jgi:hypothetical protein